MRKSRNQKKFLILVIVLPLKKLVEADSSATFDKLFEKRDEIFIKHVEFITNLIKK